MVQMEPRLHSQARRTFPITHSILAHRGIRGLVTLHSTILVLVVFLRVLQLQCIQAAATSLWTMLMSPSKLAASIPRFLTLHLEISLFKMAAYSMAIILLHQPMARAAVFLQQLEQDQLRSVILPSKIPGRMEAILTTVQQ